jgi:hypothetical protein
MQERGQKLGCCTRRSNICRARREIFTIYFFFFFRRMQERGEKLGMLHEKADRLQSKAAAEKVFVLVYQ